MTRNLLIIIVSGVITTLLTWLAISNPMLLAALVAIIFAIICFAKIAGWWRRAYVFTILAAFAGSSHFEALSGIGNIGKTLALVLFALATFTTTRGAESRYANGVHKFALFSLWLTVGLALSSTLWSISRTETPTQALAFAAFVYILHMASTRRWTDKTTLTGDINVAYWASFAALALGAILAIAGVAGAVSDYSGRYLGVLGNPNRLGVVAAITLAIGVGIAIQRRHPMIWASLLIPFSQVLLSQSRTAILAVAIGLLWVVMRGGVIRMIVGGFVAAPVLLTATVFNFNPFGETLSRFGERQGGDVLNARTQAWSDVMTLLQRDALGTGWSTTTSALAEMNQAGVTSGLSSVHNSYFQLLFELGWMGIVPVALMVCLFIAVAIRATSKELGAGLVSATVAGALIHLTESAIFGIGQPYPYLFWFAVMAAIVTMSKKSDKELPAKPVRERPKIRRKVLAMR